MANGEAWECWRLADANCPQFLQVTKVTFADSRRDASAPRVENCSSGGWDSLLKSPASVVKDNYLASKTNEFGAIFLFPCLWESLNLAHRQNRNRW